MKIEAFPHSTKHTSGPWSFEPHGNTVALYAKRTGNLHGLRLMNLDDGDHNFEANARLIASAPDLNDAVWLSRACIQHWIDDMQANLTPTVEMLEEVLRRLDAVYSKANGGQ